MRLTETAASGAFESYQAHLIVVATRSSRFSRFKVTFLLLPYESTYVLLFKTHVIADNVIECVNLVVANCSELQVTGSELRYCRNSRILHTLGMLCCIVASDLVAGKSFPKNHK